MILFQNLLILINLGLWRSSRAWWESVAEQSPCLIARMPRGGKDRCWSLTTPNIFQGYILKDLPIFY